MRVDAAEPNNYRSAAMLLGMQQNTVPAGSRPWAARGDR
jgi:hypothetical protein